MGSRYRDVVEQAEASGPHRLSMMTWWADHRKSTLGPAFHNRFHGSDGRSGRNFRSLDAAWRNGSGIHIEPGALVTQ